MALLGDIMSVSAIFLVFVISRLSSAQDVVESEANPVSDLICTTCVCADGKVDCTGKDLSSPFSEDDWEGLKDFGPIEVDLSGNPLKVLSSIAELPIRTLNYSNCNLEVIDDAVIVHLKNITVLDLSHNRISSSALNKKCFIGFVSGNHMPQTFTLLKSLSLAYNDLHSLPNDLFMFMTELTMLDLSGNPLVYIDQVTMGAMSDLTKLSELRLSGCELESLPAGMFRRQRRLERLDLSDNRFSTLPSAIGEPVNLVYLNLNKNPIVELSGQTPFANLTKLQELHLCRNSKLQTISAGALGGLVSLTSLHLCYNPRLTTLDPDFLMWEDEHEVETWPAIKELYLNHNNLSVIRSSFFHRWDQLTDADLTGNPYVCDCTSQWMVDVLVPLLATTNGSGTVTDMICKKPEELKGLSFATLNIGNKTLGCAQFEDMSMFPVPNMAIFLGIMIGIFSTFPLVLILVLLWKRGYFAKCRGAPDKSHYYDEEEDL